MCQRIVREAVERAVGCFDKRGDGMVQRFEVLVAPCECGERYYARVPAGTVWVEAEREENRDVDKIDADTFADDVEKAAAK
jgi:hypothetical protein